MKQKSSFLRMNCGCITMTNGGWFDMKMKFNFLQFCNFSSITLLYFLVVIEFSLSTNIFILHVMFFFLSRLPCKRVSSYLCRLDWKCGCVIGWCRCQNRCWWITNIMLWWCLNVILTRIQTWIAWIWVRCGTQQVGGRFTFGTFLWFL